MTRKKRFKTAKFLASVTVFIIAALWIYTESQIAPHYYISKGNELEIKTLCPTTLEKAGDEENYSVRVNLMGIIPVKTVAVTVLETARVIPGGQVYGIKGYSDGLIVVSISKVDGVFPAERAGIKQGDILTYADGKKLKTNEQLQELVNDKGKEEILLTFTRDGKKKETKITPFFDKAEGRYKIGLWLCDSTAGIGTLTFLDPTDGSYGALGHGISQTETGILMPFRKGSLVEAQIIGIEKGSSGLPGQLKGIFSDDRPLATVEENSSQGIFGKMEAKNYNFSAPVSIGPKASVHEGKAKIRCTVDASGVGEYDIEIIKINSDNSQKTRNMVIKVTDPKLLEKTGGIVQGMSGSPILQDGKLIGAVTHVLVNDSTEGYGIFIENMLAVSQGSKVCRSTISEMAA